MGLIIDALSLLHLKGLHPDFKVRVIRVLNDVFNHTGRAMRVTEGLRSYDRQAALYAQGRTTPGEIVTNAEPGNSMHAYGVAADCAWIGNSDPYLEKDPKCDELWSYYGTMCQANGLIWGGAFSEFPDRPHCEIQYGGMGPRELKRIFLVGGIIGVQSKINSLLKGL